MIMGSS